MRLNYDAFSMSVKGESTRVSHAFVKKNMFRYMMRLHGRFARCSCENAALTLGFVLHLYTRSVRDAVLASCIEISILFMKIVENELYF